MPACCGATPDHFRRHRLGILPEGDGALAGGDKCGFHLRLVGPGDPTISVQLLDRVAEHGVDERSEGVRV